MKHRLLTRAARSSIIRVVVMATAVGAVIGSAPSSDVAAQDYQRISGEGSSWAANAIDAMRVNVRQFGITVDYNPSGSTSGRRNFLNGIVDFAASDIPFQFEPEDGSAPENPEPGSYAYMPVVAGGTAFMYNLVINGERVTNLRLSGENVAKIFTGTITMWDDPALKADNPGLTLPARAIVPVVRSDGSGSSAQFTSWMIDRHPAIWDDFCNRSGRAPTCGFTSFYPTIQGMIAQSGDLGVAGYVSQSFAEGAIGYVNYSYALGVQFPVAKVLNAAGFYTEPTPENVAVSLLQARINMDESNPAVYLTQQLEGVYADTDPRNYQLSSYSYFILPTKVEGQFNEAKGYTLGAFAYYAMCQAQQQSASLGYSPMPINLVEAGFEQIRKIPGVQVQNIDIASCDNPTFSTDGSNTLAEHARMPNECDRQSTDQCPDGTGGLSNQPTTTARPENIDNGGGGGGGNDDGGGAVDDGGGGAVDDGGGGGGGGSNPSGGGANPSGGGAIPSGGGSNPSGGGSDPNAAVTGDADDSAGNGSISNPLDQATGDGSAIDDGATECDADTGVCGPAVAPDGQGNGDGNTNGEAASGQNVGAIRTVTLEPGSKWGKGALIAIVALLTLALVLAPAAAWRYLNADGQR